MYLPLFIQHQLFAYQCRLLVTFANSLDPDLVRRNVGPNLDTNCLTLIGIPKICFRKSSIWQKGTHNYSVGKVLSRQSTEALY